MNQKQREIVTEFCQKHTAGRKGNPSNERLDQIYGALMTMYHAVETRDYVMMGLVYEELSTKVKYKDLLLGVAMQQLGSTEKLKSTTETTGAVANYRKRLKVLIDFGNRVATAIQ